MKLMRFGRGDTPRSCFAPLCQRALWAAVLAPRYRCTMTFVGRSLPRLEDPALLTGKGCFAADVSFAEQVHMRVVRSAYPNARLVSVDPSAARAAVGGM